MWLGLGVEFAEFAYKELPLVPEVVHYDLLLLTKLGNFFLFHNASVTSTDANVTTKIVTQRFV